MQSDNGSDGARNYSELTCVHAGAWVTLFFAWFTAAGSYPVFRLPEPYTYISELASGLTAYIFVLFVLSLAFFFWHSFHYAQQEAWRVRALWFPVCLALLLALSIFALI